MKWRCTLPKGVSEPARAMVTEALRQTKCHSRGLLVCLYRGKSHWRDWTSGHASRNTIRVRRYRTVGKRYRITATECDGRITMTANWPPREPLAWAEALYSTALHEAAHIADTQGYDRSDRRLPHHERPMEQAAFAAQDDALKRLTPRRQELLLALAVAAEEAVTRIRGLNPYAGNSPRS